MRATLRAFTIPLVLVLALAVANCILIVNLDRSALATANGLWKSPSVSAWEHGTGTPRDSGGLNYAPWMGWLARMIPDEWMQYSTTVSDATFRKIAFINAAFGAIASAIVFSIARRFLVSNWLAIAVAAFHSSAAFIVVNSLNNEDILPAYAFYLAAISCYFQFREKTGYTWLTLAAACLAAMALLHWTLLPPALSAFGALFLLDALQGKRPWIPALVFAVTFLVGLRLLVVSGGGDYGLSAILLPQKATGSGWTGWSSEKITYLLHGVGNYFSGGFNIHDSSRLLCTVYGKDCQPDLWHLISSLAAAIFGIALCITGVKSNNRQLRMLSCFALAAFLIGQAENLYSQPQDPQMQLQPMFIIVVGIIVLLERVPPDSRRHTAIALLLLSVANFAWNVRFQYHSIPTDTHELRFVSQLNNRLPINNTLLVHTGFEGWSSWDYLVTFRGDYSRYDTRGVKLFRAFTDHDSTLARIDSGLCVGKKIFASALWNESRDEFIASATTVTSKDQAGRYFDLLRQSARSGATVRIQDVEFVELLRTPVCPAATN